MKEHETSRGETPNLECGGPTPPWMAEACLGWRAQPALRPLRGRARVRPRASKAASGGRTLHTGQTYSYRNASVGRNCDARLAGIIPKITPTKHDTPNATAIDTPEIGMY